MLDSDAVPMGYHRIHREVRDFISEETIVVADGASTMDISRQVVNSYKPRHRIDAGIYGCVGTGVPFSIAAKVYFPDKPVICLNGDWAFGFNGMDIETACRFKLPVVFMIYQNGNIDKWVRTEDVVISVVSEIHNGGARKVNEDEGGHTTCGQTRAS